MLKAYSNIFDKNAVFADISQNLKKEQAIGTMHTTKGPHEEDYQSY